MCRLPRFSRPWTGRVLLLGLLLLIGPAAPLWAAEEILAYDSRIAVQANGDLLVTETIRVRAEGERIKRGIFRDFPTIIRRPSGLVDRHGFAVLAVSRDGAPEDWHTEAITGGTRVYIGQAEVLLTQGEHTFTLRYRTTRQLRHLADADEVYWNVTGNFWWFPIRSASATIVLPQPVAFLREAVYTGHVGATGSDAHVSARSDGRISFATTRALDVGEGLTVAAAFPKGLVPAPGAAATALRLLQDNLGFFILIGAVPLIGLYLLITWWRVGRDPPRGVVIPLFEPPAELAPAAASWVYFRGAGVRLRGASRTLVAALMSLAVQGRVTLTEQGRDLLVQRAPDRPGSRDRLAKHERVLEDELLGRRPSIAISRANATDVQYAVRTFDNALDQELKGRFYRFNSGAIALAVVASLAAIGLFFWLFTPSEAQVMVLLAALGVAAIGGNLVVRGVRRIVGDTPGAATAAGWVMAPLGLGLLAVGAGLLLSPGFAALLAHLGLPSGDLHATAATRVIAVAAAALVLLNLVFGALLFAPTPGGRRLAEALEGFRLYLSVAEAERLNMAGRPDFTTTLFERYLPYAIALGVERPWSEALESHLARSRPGDSEQDYRPRFYSGRHFDAARIGASTAAIASTLGASFAAATPAPSSGGGGSSGGGSSGGGGGGGGGGGW